MRAVLRFYAELRDFLAPERRSGTVTHTFDVPGSVKDVIEASGVPHTEVDLILANGESVDFSYQMAEGDRISVYPVFESFDISSVARVRPEPLRQVRFVLDGHLGRLARYLRLLGFDSLSRQHLEVRPRGPGLPGSAAGYWRPGMWNRSSGISGLTSMSSTFKECSAVPNEVST